MPIADTGLYYNPQGATLDEQWSSTKKPGYLNAIFSGQDNAAGVPLFRYEGGDGLVQGYPYAGQSSGSGSDGGGTEGGVISIPENAFPQSRSYSGLPDWAMEPLKELAPRLGGLVTGLENALTRLDDIPNLVDAWSNQASNAYLSGLPSLEEKMRAPMEGLVGRGVWDGTMSRDAMVGLGRALADDYRTQQSELAAQGLATKAQGLADTAQARTTATALLGDLLDLARTSESSSEDRLSRYTSLLSLLL